METNEITSRIIGCAFTVHNTLGPGFLESVCENALRIELEACGLLVRQQHPLPVYYKDRSVGDFYADLLVADRVVVEIKAVQRLIDRHEVQLVHYLTAARIEDGLLINFGPSVQVKRKYRTYRAREKTGVKGQDEQD